MRGADAVSYTHLDVYKRQVQEAQEGDQECQAWRNDPAAATARGYRVDNGLVWKDRRNQKPGLYVPPSVRMEVIRHFHDLSLIHI